MLAYPKTQKARAFEHIVLKLISGELPAGSRVTELSLSRSMHMSRGPIREALNQLASKGWIELVPGMGAYVKTPSKSQLAQLYACREALETFVVAEACRFINPEQLRRLRRSLQLAADVLKIFNQNPAAVWENHALPWLDADLLLHQTLLDAANCPQIYRVFSDLNLMARAWTQKPDFQRYPIVNALTTTFEEHRHIVEAVTNRDRHAAQSWMRWHIRRIGRCFLRQYSPGDTRLRHSPEFVSRLMQLEADLMLGSTSSNNSFNPPSIQSPITGERI